MAKQSKTIVTTVTPLKLKLDRRGRVQVVPKWGPGVEIDVDDVEIHFRIDGDVRAIWPPRPTARQNKLGAPLKHDWDDYKQKFLQLWQEKGDFQLPQNQIAGWNSQAAAARMLLDYIQTRCGAGEEPHQKTVEG